MSMDTLPSARQRRTGQEAGWEKALSCAAASWRDNALNLVTNGWSRWVVGSTTPTIQRMPSLT